MRSITGATTLPTTISRRASWAPRRFRSRRATSAARPMLRPAPSIRAVLFPTTVTTVTTSLSAIPRRSSRTRCTSIWVAATLSRKTATWSIRASTPTRWCRLTSSRAATTGRMWRCTNATTPRAASTSSTGRRWEPIPIRCRTPTGSATATCARTARTAT